MSTQPEALRLADECESAAALPTGLYAEAATELRRLQAEKEALLRALGNLCSAAYWIFEGGEFSAWIEDKEMPWAAAKEFQDFAEMTKAARFAIDAARGKK